MIQVKGLRKCFGENEVLKSISFSVDKGETIAVIGQSGSGKSTMLRCLINLEKADGGEIEIEGEKLMEDGKYPGEKDMRRICRKMCMVFQSFNLFPHMSVMDNLISAPVIVNKENKETAIARGKALLNKVGLSGKERAFPSQLSGGQQQRVAIARALMVKPDMLLFDEPTSALDPHLTGEVLAVIKQLAQEHMTMIVVTHEMGFAREVADRVLYMADGRIIESGPSKEIFGNPQDPGLKAFIGSIL